MFSGKSPSDQTKREIPYFNENLHVSLGACMSQKT